MGRWFIAALAPAALIAVPSAIPQTVVGRTVLRTIELRPGSTKAFALTCPAAYVAVSGGVYRPAPGVATLSIRSTGPRSFLFRFGNPPSNSVRRPAVAVACQRIAQGSLRLRLRAIKRPVTVRVGASSRRDVRVTCPPGTFAAAAGFDLGRAVNALALERETQTFRAFAFRVVNRASGARTASFRASCLTILKPSGSSAQLRVSLTSETVAVDSGAQFVRRRCPAGWLALTAGYSLRAGLELEGAAVALREARWSVTSDAAGELPATFELACSRVFS